MSFLFLNCYTRLLPTLKIGLLSLSLQISYFDSPVHGKGDTGKSPFKPRQRPSSAFPHASPSINLSRTSSSGSDLNYVSSVFSNVVNTSLTYTPSIRRSPDGGIIMELHPSPVLLQRQSSEGSASSSRPSSSSDRENRKKSFRNQNLRPENFHENILIGGSPIVGHRLAEISYSGPLKYSNAGEPSHSRSMSSLAVPTNPLIRVSHSRGGSGRSIDVLDSSAPQLQSGGGHGQSIDVMDSTASSFHSRKGSGRSLDASDATASSFHSRGGSGRSLDVLDTSSTPFYPSMAAFNPTQLERGAEIFADSGSNLRRESTPTLGVTASVNPSMKSKYPRKGGHLFSKFTGTSFSASFH